ncbi:MAG: hypothetical protein HUK24_03925, partial [Sphaerochaetaceae bacterium]|nr:hypothetical protein [Sphaerochaetaceae bacterium]
DGTLSNLISAVELVKLCNDYNTKVVMYNYLTNEDMDLYSMNQAYAYYNQAKQAVVIQSDVVGDFDGTVTAKVLKALSSLGLRTSDSANEPTAIAKVSIVWT